MNIYTNPGETQLRALLQRPTGDPRTLDRSVRRIMEAVRKHGDKAIRKYTKEFDGVRLRQMEVKEKEIRAAEKALSPDLRDAIRQAARNIRRFHESQLREEEPVETMRGVSCWRKSIPIQSVGLYIPGGTAPLFSTA